MFSFPYLYILNILRDTSSLNHFVPPFIEAENVTITFDQASFTCEEDSICTVTGSLEHLTGEIQADFNVSLIVDFNIDLQSGTYTSHNIHAPGIIYMYRREDKFHPSVSEIRHVKHFMGVLNR